MQLTVFGSNGKVGKLVVAEALKRKHTVVAFVHKTHTLEPNPKLHIVQGSIFNIKSVTEAIQGSEAVISALGSWGTPQKNVLTKGMQNIIHVMKDLSTDRIISITGADARTSSDTLSLIHRISYRLFKLVANKILIDGEQHIKLLEESDLKWTVVRSPMMINRGKVKNFALDLTRPLPWQTINRESVAYSMVDLLHNKNYLKQAPFIIRSR